MQQSTPYPHQYSTAAADIQPHSLTVLVAETIVIPALIHVLLRLRYLGSFRFSPTRALEHLPAPKGICVEQRMHDP